MNTTPEVPVINKKRRLVLRITGVILAIVILLIALAPTILSMDPVRIAILNKVKEASGTDIAMQSWSIGWFKGIQITGLAINEPKQGLKATIKSMSIATPLYKLIIGTKNIGDLEIIDPDITINIPTAQSSQSAAINQDIPAPAPAISDQPSAIDKTAAKKEEPAKQTAAQPVKISGDIKGQIKIQNGIIKTTYKDKTYTAIDGLQVEAKIQSINKPITFSITGYQKKDAGTLAVNGSMKIFEKGMPDPKSMQGNAHIKIDNLDLSPFSLLAKGGGSPVNFAGTLNVNSDITINNTADLQAKGYAVIDNLRLSGELLKGDRPVLDRTELTFEITGTGNSIDIKNFQFKAPFLNATVQGNLQPNPKDKVTAGSLKGNAMFYFPAFASQFPNTIGLQKDLKINRGNANVDFAYQAANDVMTSDVSFRILNLEANQGDKIIRMGAPIETVCKIVSDKNGIRLDNLQLTSSFAQASGKGNLDKFECDIKADLGKAIAEIRKFKDLGALNVSGTLTSSARITASSESKRKIDINADINDLSIEGNTPAPIQEKHISLSASSELELSKDNKPVGMSGISVQLKSGIANADAKIASIQIPSQDKPLEIDNIDIKLNAVLGKLASLAATATRKPLPMAVDGQLAISVENAGLKKNIFSLPIASANITDLSLTKDGKKIVEPQISLKTDTRFDIANKAVSLKLVEIASSIIDLKGSGTLSDVGKGNRLSIKGTLEPDGKRIAELVSVLSGIKVEIEGRKPRDFNVDTYLSGTTWQDLVRPMNASAGLFLERIKLFGIDVAGLDIKIVSASAKTSTAIDADVNGGKLSVRPVIDLTGKTPYLNLPDNSQVISNIPLTDDMVSSILVKITPILYGCGAAGGRISLKMDKLHVPLNETLKTKTIASGKLELKDVSLAPTGMLQEVLSIAKLDLSHPLKITSQEITFDCRDGKITTSPLILKTSDCSITISGFAGMDGTINYTADIPITEKMVDKNIYQYAKGLVIKLPIGGTVQKPKISSDAFRSELEKLAVKAGKNVLEEKGTELLNDLFNKKKKKKQP